MYVHRLAFAAIGPFAGEHSIDFDGLGGSALFLIDGPTGAGKSTIIDALVFALFGEVAGSGSDKQRLRSGFAAEEQESFAEVEFSTTFGRYRVRRTPEYARAKKRGPGLTTVASTVHLERSTGEHGWESISRTKGEADAEISRALGLSRAQFLQTVVLPQGEFATFLKAESKDRQVVLERIFATDLYSRVEAALDEQRKQANADREAVDDALIKAVARVTDRLPNDERPDLAEPGVDLDAPESVVARVEAIVCWVAGRMADAEADLAASERAHMEAKGQLAHMEALGELVHAASAAAAAVAAAQARVAAAAAAVSARSELLCGEEGDPLARLDQLIGSLEHAVERERELPAARKAVAAAQRQVDEVRGRIARLEHEREHVLPARLLALSSALADAARAADVEARRRHDHEAALVDARIAGMAGELAATLRDGDPCPVCGAIDHPAPRPPEPRQVSADDVALAQRQRMDADQVVQKWAVQAERLTAAANGLEPAVDASEPPPHDLLSAITSFHDRVRTVEADLLGARGDLAVAESVLAQTQTRLDELLRLIDDARAGFDSVLARREDLREARTALDEQQHAHSSLVHAQEVARTAAQALEGADGEFDPDVALALKERLRGADTAVRRAISVKDQVERLLADVRQRQQQVVECLAARTAVWAQTGDVIALANLVKGGDGNALKQPLSAFVVQSMFDEILEAANRRLQVMLDGRFSLKATEERTGRALSGQGLGLEVIDQRTDTVRKTSTLSGGESFCASLALALGLADTVRANAGGVELGMLFIDEGFGSLDGNRLDDVMAELLRLRADGRTVGVISHVSEMKKSINERIDVSPIDARGGSILSVSWEQ